MQLLTESLFVATFSDIRVILCERMCIGYKYSYQLALVVFADWLADIQNIPIGILLCLSSVLLLDNSPEKFSG